VLKAALRAQPDDAALHAKLGNVELDAYDYAAAATAFENALRLDPGRWPLPIQLARCRNVLEQHEAALEALGDTQADTERGIALFALGRVAEAEAELRAVLGVQPENRRAGNALCTLLRVSGRPGDLLALCEALYARGIDHAQLFYEWGRALALTGDTERAKHLLFDPARVQVRRLPVPDGFGTLDDFNAALAAEILESPDILSEFPPHEEANRGSSRVHNLLSGRRPEIIRALFRTLQALVSEYRPEPAGDFDPWPRARPVEAHLHAWGLIQRGGAYEDWHTHRGGWLSGVYYVRVPEGVSCEGDGRGCIEFGPPSALYDTMPELVARRRYLPVEGTLLMAPSHYAHRTIPSGIDANRISFAFDVAPH
jgi:tetratricopeptide (TPR) repeat protein